MKKLMAWIFGIALAVFVIDWGVVGVKLLDGDYDITAGVYIGLVCIVVIFICGLYKGFSDKCPYCGKLRMSRGEYCSHCGKKIGE